MNKNLIGGQWVEAEGGGTFESRNPADTSDLIGVFPDSDKHDVARAVAAADEAFFDWKQFPAPRRAEILFEAAEVLKRKKEELSKLMTREMGKVLNEARGDVQEGVDMTYYIAGEGRRLHGYTTKAELPNKATYARREPIGRIAVITPWNFPLAIPTWKLMPALVAGNTVVWKPATDTPRLAYELAVLLQEAGLPDGVLNVVFGHGKRVGQPLVEHEKIDMLTFTGSTEVGRHLYRVAADKLNVVHLEMGGKNPLIVMDDADLDLALDGIIWGAFGTTGQRCTAASRIIVHKGVIGEVIERLVTATKQLKVGNGLDEEIDVGPVINKAQLDTIHHYVEIGQQGGAELLCGGRVLDSGSYVNGYFYEPTVFAGVTPEMRIFKEEIFGPVAVVVEAQDYEDAIRIANNTDYGLSSAIYTRDVNLAHRAMDDLEAGIVYINSSTIGAEIHLPFGGVKGTGNGHREAGQAALETYTEWKAVYIDYSGRLQKAQGIE
ncbi:MAG: aldehyde dehydrogenase family protein [Candidatus Bipolaricaulia bacterium]